MKRLKKVLLTLGLAGMVSLSSAFLISCNEEENEISVSFNTNGAATISDATINVGDNYKLPVPSREGYRFDGWYADADFTSEPVTEIVAAANVTYYAKWTQVFAVNLDVNGGSLDTTTIYLEQGANVYDAVKDLQPTKSGLTFGAWFNGNNELSKNYSMKTEALNLTAQYKVGYTVEIYLQNLTDDGYTKADTLTGSEYVGKSFKSSQKQTGFTDVSEQATLTKTLSATAAENIFRHYFDRNTYTVTLNPNYPGQGLGQTTSKTVKFGEKIVLPSDPTQYDFEGYCLLGWTESSTSEEVEYAADLDQLLYNKSNSEAKELEYTVSRTTTLYGVWQKGYTDMFGGNDYIYYLGGEDAAVYLCRGNVYFKGELDEKTGEFYFEDEDENEIIEGKLLDNGKYMYAQKKTTSVLYQSGVGVVETTKIRFDKYNELTYTVYNESNVKIEESSGTYQVVQSGEYVVSFTDGAKKGKTMNFLLGTVTNEDGGTISAFQIRNDEEFAIGKMIMAGVIKDAEGVYTVGSAQAYIELDGFGTAIYSTSSGSTTYKYVMNEDGSILFTDRNDNPVQTFAVIDMPNMKGQKGYIAYDETMKDTFEISTNETLTLDGVYNAVYVKSTGERIESYYAAQVSPMGSTIVSIIDPATKTEYKFMLTPEIDYVSEEVNGEQVTTEITTYSAKSILNTYAEYYYKDGESIYYAPMLVIDEKEAGKASVYGYTSNRTFVKVSEGKYEVNDEGLYLYTVEKTFDAPEAYSDPIDLTTISSFVFALDTETIGYSVNYWYSSNNEENKYYVDYANTDITSEATLKLVGGFAFYKPDSSTPTLMGAYSLNGNLLQLTVKDEVYYFNVDEDGKKFTVLKYAPYVAYQMNTDNTYQINVYLDFDGLGNAVYTEKAEESGTDLLISGTITVVTANSVETETVFGAKVYKFTPIDSANADKAFEFIQATGGGRTYFAVKETKFTQEKYFTSSNSALSGVLTIDGYCTWAKFVDDQENSYEGVYYVENNSIVLLADRLFYFDFTEDEFTVRGEEYGLYALYDNHYTNGVFVELDGYGNLSAFTFELKAGSTEEYERVEIAANGEYTIDGDVYTFSYGTGEQTRAYTCVLNGTAFKGYDGEIYQGFTVSREVGKSVYVDTSDWSVLLLDEFGRATKYDHEGNKQVGRYVVITDTLLYFVGNNGKDACIYNYDSENGYATPIELEPKSYYTQDLKSLYFDKAGFAIFNGNVDENIFYAYEGNDVVIFRRAKDGEQANDYGFVKENFGLLEEEKVYNNETYYRNYGTDIQFTRSTAEVEKYPIVYNDTEIWYLSDIQFAPSGGAEFNVAGKAKISRKITKNGTTTTVETDQDCTVTRTIVDDKVEMYVTILGVYRYYITATYQGDGDGVTNPYQVKSLSYVQSLSAYRYIDVLFRIYYMYGATSANAYKNDFGSLTITIDYNEDGTVKKSSMSAEIGEAAEIVDMNGNLISFDESVFEFTSNGGVAEFKAQDGYTYRLAFGVQRHQYLNAIGYFIISFARVQTLEYGDYSVKVSRTVATEANGILVGDVYSIAVSKNDQGVQAEEFYVEDGKLIYIARTRDVDGYVTAATYYTITLVENESGSVGEEGVVPTYKSVTVTESVATVLCEKDPTEEGETYKGKDRYVEIVDGEIKYLQLVGNKRYAKSSSYDEATKIYTVETTDGRTYYVKLTEDGKNVIITDELPEL